MQQKSWLGFLLVLGAAFLWGLAGTTARVLFVKFDAAAIDLVGIRLWFAGGMLAAWLAMRRPAVLRLQRRDWGAIVLFGLLGMAALQFTYLFAIERTNVATAIFLEYQAPVIVALYWALTGVRRVTAGRWLVLAVAVGGSLLLVLGSAEGLAMDGIGLVSGIASAVLMAFYGLYAESRLRHIAPTAVLALGLLVGAVAWSALSPPWRWGALGLAPETWAGMAYIALFGTVIPFIMYLTALRHIDSGQATLVAASEPVIAAVAAFLILGESLTPVQIAGCTLILLAIAALQLTGRAAAGSAAEAAANSTAEAAASSTADQAQSTVNPDGS